MKGWSFWLGSGEVDGVNGATRTDFGALATGLALGWVDVSQIAAHFDGLEGTLFQALLATDATYRAVLDHQGTLVGVDAAYIDATVFLAARTHFDDATRAGLGAHTATHTFVGVDDGQPRLLVDVQRIEVTLLHAVAEAEAAFGAAAFAGVERVGESANVSAFIMHLGG